MWFHKVKSVKSSVFFIAHRIYVITFLSFNSENTDRQLVIDTLNEDVNRNYKEYGSHNDRGMRGRDGFCFTQTAIEGKESEDGIRENDIVDAMAIIYTTFVNESDMTDTQRITINKRHLETWMHCLEDLHIVQDQKGTSFCSHRGRAPL